MEVCVFKSTRINFQSTLLCIRTKKVDETTNKYHKYTLKTGIKQLCVSYNTNFFLRGAIPLCIVILFIVLVLSLHTICKDQIY